MKNYIRATYKGYAESPNFLVGVTYLLEFSEDHSKNSFPISISKLNATGFVSYSSFYAFMESWENIVIYKMNLESKGGDN